MNFRPKQAGKTSFGRNFSYAKEKPKSQRAVLPETNDLPSAERLLVLYQENPAEFEALAKKIGWKPERLLESASTNNSRQKAEQYTRDHAPRPPRSESDPVVSLMHAAWSAVLGDLTFLIEGYNESALQSLRMQADELVKFKLTDDGEQVELRNLRAKRFYRRAYLTQALANSGWKSGMPTLEVCEKASEYLQNLQREINLRVEREAAEEAIGILRELTNKKDDYFLREMYEAYAKMYADYVKVGGDFSKDFASRSSIQEIFGNIRKSYNTRNEPSPLNQWSYFRMNDIETILVANMLAMRSTFLSSWTGYTSLTGATGAAEVSGVFADYGGTNGDVSGGGIGASFEYSRSGRRPRRYTDEGNNGT